jgi:hypothetical protein
MDEDLATMSREELIGEVRRLRYGIREHRDSSGHDLCCGAPVHDAEYDGGRAGRT